MADIYEIHVKGHIDQPPLNWLGELTLTHHEDGTTTLTGPIVDQSALRGLLIGLWDLGMTLISVKRMTPPDD